MFSRRARLALSAQLRQVLPPILVGCTVVTPVIAILQGALLLYEYRIRHGNSQAHPEVPSQGFVEATTLMTSSRPQSPNLVHTKNKKECDRSSRQFCFGYFLDWGPWRQWRQRRRSNPNPHDPLPSSRASSSSLSQPPLRLLVIGDSLAAGVGQKVEAVAEEQEQDDDDDPSMMSSTGSSIHHPTFKTNSSTTNSPVLPQAIARSLLPYCSRHWGRDTIAWTCVGSPGLSTMEIVQEIYQLDDHVIPLLRTTKTTTTTSSTDVPSWFMRWRWQWRDRMERVQDAMEQQWISSKHKTRIWIRELGKPVDDPLLDSDSDSVSSDQRPEQEQQQQKQEQKQEQEQEQEQKQKQKQEQEPLPPTAFSPWRRWQEPMQHRIELGRRDISVFLQKTQQMAERDMRNFTAIFQRHTHTHTTDQNHHNHNHNRIIHNTTDDLDHDTDCDCDCDDDGEAGIIGAYCERHETKGVRKRPHHPPRPGRKRTVVNHDFVNQFDIVVVLTGLNDLKDRFLPFMMSEQRSLRLAESRMHHPHPPLPTAPSSSSSSSPHNNSIHNDDDDDHLNLNPMNRRSNHDDNEDEDDDESESNSVFRSDLLRLIHALKETVFSSAPAFRLQRPQPQRRSRSRSRRRPRRPPLIVFPALPLAAIELSQRAPLSWFIVPIITGMDRQKQVIAESLPHNVIYVPAPAIDDLSHAENDHHAQQQAENAEGRLLGRRTSTHPHPHLHHYPQQHQHQHHPGASMVSMDGIHPNDHGYESWGKFIAQAIVEHWQNDEHREKK